MDSVWSACWDGPYGRQTVFTTTWRDAFELACRIVTNHPCRPRVARYR